MHAQFMKVEPAQQLINTIERYKSALVAENFDKVFEYGLVEDLGNEAIADWLTRCPLDFGGM